MSLTPNFGFNIPDSTDIVNLLTQCYPNFTIADTALQAIKAQGISQATESKSGTVHNVVRVDSDCSVFWFTATSNFTTGDTFTVDGSPVTAVKVSGAGLETGDFVINSNVPCIIKGSVLTVLAGGGSSTVIAEDVPYDNTGSGLTATDVQDAIDELKSDIPTGFSATAITYDNTGSGLTATNAQDAIDELKTLIPASPQYITTGLSVKQNRVTINDGGYYIDNNNYCHVDITVTMTGAQSGAASVVVGFPDSMNQTAQATLTATFNNAYMRRDTTETPTPVFLRTAGAAAAGATIHFIGSYEILH